MGLVSQEEKTKLHISVLFQKLNKERNKEEEEEVERKKGAL